jgi:hypothetical protein
MSKYEIPVSIETTASKTIGTIKCDTLKEFKEKAEKLWEGQDHDYPTANITNDFDLSDWDLSEVSEDDLRYYKAV